MARSGHTERGVGELAAVIVLAVLGLAWAAFEHARRSEQIEYERARAAGAVFASWMLAAHRSAQEDESRFVNDLSAEPGVAVTQTELVMGGFAPAWLARDTILGQFIALGVVDDGSEPDGVPMAFAVASPSRPLSQSSAEGFRAGAALGGVVGIESLGTELGAETFSGLRRAGIEHALGRPLTDVDMVSVADLGVVYDERVVHRRRQPGRAYLSEMRTDLTFASGAGIVDAGAVEARDMKSSGDFSVGRLANVSFDVEAAQAEGDADGVSLELGRVHGDGALMLSGGMAVRRAWTVNGMLEAGRVHAHQELRASTVVARVAVGPVPVLAVGGEVEVTGRLSGTPGAEPVPVVTAGIVMGKAPDGLSGTITGHSDRSLRIEAVYGVADKLTLTGNLDVTERCYGCAP